MIRLTTIYIGLLCIILTSCATEEISLGEDHDHTVLSTRSAENILIVYTDTLSVAHALSATQVDIDHLPNAAAMLTVTQNGNQQSSYSVISVSLVAAQGYELHFTVEEETYVSSGLDIVNCNQTLCYTDATGSYSGTGQAFIVEEEASGV